MLPPAPDEYDVVDIMPREFILHYIHNRCILVVDVVTLDSIVASLQDRP